MPTLDLPDGKKLNYREEGAGPALLLVHGSPAIAGPGGGSRPISAIASASSPSTCRGYGGSDGVPDEPLGRAALMGAAVARLAESAGPVRLAGHSYGGVVAVQAALQAKPGTIEALVLLEPVFFRALQLTNDRQALDPAAAHFEDYASRASAGEPGVVRLMIDYWFGDLAFARMPDPVRAYLDANAPRNAIDVRSSFNDTRDAEISSAAFTPPVRVVCGDRSLGGGGGGEVVRAIGRGLLQLMPNASLEALAGANHGMLDSHSEAVARLIAG